MEKKIFLRRAQLLQSFTLLCVIFMLISIVRISAILPGLSKEDDRKKSQAREKAYRKEYTRGSILDREGGKICWSEKPMGDRRVIHPYAYSGLTGYWSVRYGTAGLEKTYDAYLTKSRSPKGKKTGANLTLTLDMDLQEEAWRQIKDFEGSVVVLKVETGEILAIASSPSFNLEELDDKWEEICEEPGMLLPNAYRNPAAPGSVFKIVTSREILEEGIDKETVEDKGYLVVNGQKIHNYNGTAHGSLSFSRAFVLSSNVYFMDRALKMGSARLEESASAFLIGREIPLDFTTLTSSFDMEDGSDNLLAVTAFGQGNTLITPLQMAMIGQSVAADGIMKKPWLVQSVKDGSGSEILRGEARDLTETMRPETARKLRKVMKKAARHYGMRKVGPKGYDMGAKTGTAQRGDDSNNAWLVTMAPADKPEYVIVVSRLHTKKIGKDLAPVAEDLYDLIFDKEEDSMER